MVYKYIEIVGTSPTGINEAVNNAFKEASKTVKNFNGVKWVELPLDWMRISKLNIR